MFHSQSLERQPSCAYVYFEKTSEVVAVLQKGAEEFNALHPQTVVSIISAFI